MGRMLPTLITDLDSIIAGRGLTASEALAVAEAPDEALPDLLAATQRLRRRGLGEAISLCGIVNARSGGCDQDCAFCAQSAHHTADTQVFPFRSVADIATAAQRAKRAGAEHFSIVTSGNTLTDDDLDHAALAVAAIVEAGLVACASLGVLDETALARLHAAGLTRYHHNLEAAESFYPQVCTTRSYADNVAVLATARRVGLEVCAGCLFGLGESWVQRIELFADLRRLDVDSAPINFLIPIPGTPLAARPRLTPGECLRILLVARLCLPPQEIRVCGGRENLGDHETAMFAAGVSGLMIGDLLTVSGPDPARDRAMLAALGLPVVEAP
jgi:biotin synthase